MQNPTITVGILGGAGYTAGELLRLLLPHPQGRSSGGGQLPGPGWCIPVHDDLVGETNRCLTSRTDAATRTWCFLCLGHGNSQAVAG
ncbi:MAG: hypothetical protein WKG07_38390 [Hymenobacter sp.]